MKPASTLTGRLIAAFTIIAGTTVLLSWDLPGQFPAPATSGPSLNSLEILAPVLAADQDTVPNRNKKIRNIDEAIEELDRVDIDEEISNAMKSVNAAMKELTPEKLRLQTDKALKEVDFDKITKEVQESIARIDWDKMKQSMEAVKKIDFEGLQKELQKVQQQLSAQAPEIRRELEKAKGQIEKAKIQLKAYKSFIDGLESDGLLNQKEGFTLEHKNGELKINGKKASTETMKKYKSFLDDHKTFLIQNRDGEFNLNDKSNFPYNDNDDDENDNLS